MRQDLDKIIFTPFIGAPLYYSDMAIISFGWYLARLKKAGFLNFELTASFIFNTSTTIASPFFGRHADTLSNFYNYFLDKENFDYRAMRTDYAWVLDKSSDESQTRYDELMNMAAKTWATHFMRTYRLAEHYASIFGVKKTNEYYKIFNLKNDTRNPFVDAVTAIARNQRSIPLFLIFLATAPDAKISLVGVETINKEDWMLPFTSPRSLDKLTSLILNPTPDFDWLVFNEPN